MNTAFNSREQDISIIVPVYNAQKYLTRCLDSIVNQTHASLQIIIINDGSTDNSLDICNSYAQIDRRIVLFTQKNQGVVAARNKGIQAATGRYILFIDADDSISLDYCKILFNTAEQTEADIVFSNVHRVENGTIVDTSAYSSCLRTSLHERLALIKEVYYPAPWGKICRNEIINSNAITFFAVEGYFGFAEDILFALEITHAARRIVPCDAVYFYHRDSLHSLCSDPIKQDKNNNHRLIIIDKMLIFAMTHGVTQEACVPVLQAVENHLRWGGKETTDTFMEGLESRGYDPFIVSYFKNIVAELPRNGGFLKRGKEHIKKNLWRFSWLYSGIAHVYRRVRS